MGTLGVVGERRAEGQAGEGAGILATDADAAVAERLRQAVGVLGVRLERVDLGGDGSYRVVIVVQGPGAAGDAEWQAAVAKFADARLVPVVLEGVPDAEVPEPMSRLNWIRWPAAGGGNAGGLTEAGASTAVFTALNADFDRLTFHRELEAETQAWVGGGRDGSLLIDDFRQARRADEFLSDAGGDVLTRPDAEMVRFVELSLAAARRARKKRRWRWIRRGFAVAVVLIVFLTVLSSRKSHIANSHLALIVSGAKQLEGRPDRGAMMAAATLVQGQPVAYEMARQVLLETLSVPWSQGVLGVEETAGLLDAVPVGSGGRVYTIDADGQVASWDTRTGGALWQREVGIGASGMIAASLDGRRLAVVDGRDLLVAEVSPWRVTHYELPVAAESIAYDGRRSRFVVAGPRSLFSVAASGEGALASGPDGAEVLDLVASGAGGTIALVESAPRLVEALDPVSGRVLARPPALPGEIEMAAVGPAGEVVVDVDRRLFAGTARSWRPLGREELPAGRLRVLPGGILVSGGWGAPLEMTDLASGLDLGFLCSATVAVGSIRSTRSGDLVTCTNGWVTELWSTRGQRPLHRSPASRFMGSKPHLERGGMTIRGGHDGLITVDVAGSGPSSGSYALWVGPGAVTAVALHRNGHSIVAGTSRGGIAEFDLRNGNLSKTVQWRAPSGSPVRQVGWTRRPGSLLLGTADGLWWQLGSCDSCQDPREAIAIARERFWPCYPEDALGFMSEETESFLDLSACKLPPDPR